MKQILSSDGNDFVIYIPDDSFELAEKLVKQGKIKIIEFEVNDCNTEFKTCYYRETYTDEHIIGHIWPTSWGYYGYKDGYMIFKDKDKVNMFNHSCSIVQSDLINKK